MVKRLFAVGVGAAMIGATAMGALAAADLKDYPAMFVKDGTFNGYFVVGEKAASVDNLAMTDIASSMKYTKVADTKSGSVKVEGDAWQVGTSSKKFEMVNSNASDSALTGETLRDVATFIDSADLAALGDGSWTTNEQSYSYHQYIFFDDFTGVNDIVKYTRDKDNKDADFFYVKNSRYFARYRMEFTSTARSDVTDSTGASDVTGTYLDDFKNTDLTIMGKPFTVVLARRTIAPTDGIKLTLMAGAAHDTVLEGETKSYTVGDKAYEVTLAFVDDDEAKFIVNGESTNKLKVGDTFVLKDKSEVGVSEILYQSYAGGVHSATFFVGAQKMVLQDDAVTDTTGAYNVKVGSEDIDGTTVIIAGTNNNNTFTVSTLDVNMTSQDDYYVGAGQKLSDVIATAGDEKQLLFTNAWDVEYKGLTKENTHDLSLSQSSSKRYHLHLFDGDGKEVELPVAYAETNSGTTGYNLSFGEEPQTANSRADQKRLHVTEGMTNDGILQTPSATTNDNAIYKDDYFVVTGGTQNPASDGAAKSYLLQYKGADKQTKTSPKLKFKNLGSGETLEYSVSSVTAGTTATVATVKLGGYSFIVQNASSVESDDFQVLIDLNGGGAIGTNQVTFVDSYGAEFAFGGNASKDMWINSTTSSATGDWIQITQTTPNGDDYDNLAPSNVVLNITSTTDPEVRAALSGLTLKTPEGKSEIAYGYTSLGTWVTQKVPSSDPQEYTLTYPEKQLLPQVFFTSGATKSGASAAAGNMAAVTVVDATKLDSEVADAKAQNLIVVGGPCVNSVAAELMGNPASCADGFTPGKARVKLWEHANGNVAMLVAGYSGADTRLAGKVLAHRASELTGTEVEVEGTTYTDATIGAPTAVAKVEAAPAAPATPAADTVAK